MTTKVKIYVSFYHPSKISNETLDILGGQNYIDGLNKDGQERITKAKSLGLTGTKVSDGEFVFDGELNGNYDEVSAFVKREFNNKGTCVCNPKYLIP